MLRGITQNQRSFRLPMYLHQRLDCMRTRADGSLGGIEVAQRSMRTSVNNETRARRWQMLRCEGLERRLESHISLRLRRQTHSQVPHPSPDTDRYASLAAAVSAPATTARRMVRADRPPRIPREDGSDWPVNVLSHEELVSATQRYLTELSAAKKQQLDSRQNGQQPVSLALLSLFLTFLTMTILTTPSDPTGLQDLRSVFEPQVV